MATETRAWPDIAIPPGEVLIETLEAMSLPQAELARRINRPAQAISEIVNGTKQVTPETALQFERALGIPAHFWLRLEADYRYVLARLEDKKRLLEEVETAQKYPFNEMAKLGWVESTREPVKRVEILLSFFAVSSLMNVQEGNDVAWRKSARVTQSREALTAWLRQGKRIAARVSTGAFHEDSLSAGLEDIKRMSREEPSKFEPELKGFLASRGVALVLVPHLPRTGAQAATHWMGEKAIVQMSLRYKWADVFWFSLFHELAHLILHGRKRTFVEFTGNAGKPEAEAAADQFACEKLIPAKQFERFAPQAGLVSKAAVRRFADELGIAPSIVIGRLHHEQRIPHSHLNDMRPRFQFAESKSESQSGERR